ncbi:organic cation transporter protein-like [Ptychodera flava]|uniref:organic cation transporter protein-like n=1 Tax=Ptychodera flava TaxID=63121 RepID=UPI00396A9C51
MLQFDDVLKHILGERSSYQMMVFFLLGLTAMLTSMDVISPVFVMASTPSWCKVPTAEELRKDVCKNNTTTDCAALIKALTMPMEQVDIGCGAVSTYSQCYRYNVTVDSIRYSIADGVTPSSNESKIPCDHGWEYDRSQYKSTVAQQFDLVCDRKYLISLSTSLFMLGTLVGSVVFGIFLDRYGRKRGLMVGASLIVTCGTLTAFSPNYEVFALSRFCIAVAYICVYLAAFVLVTELAGTSQRTKVGMAYKIFFGVGYMLLSLEAYYIRVWRILQLVINLPCILLLSYWWIVPESPRWLLSKGKTEEAEKVIRRLGRLNGRPVPDDLYGESWNPDKTINIDTDRQVNNEDRKSYCEMLDLLRLPNMRKKTLILVYGWVIINLHYYGLAFNTSNLGGSDYVNCFVSGAVEIPGAFLGIVIMDWQRLGRRWSLFYMMVIAGITCVCAGFLPPCGSLVWLGITLASTSKFCIACSFNMIYVFSAELFPTPVRSIGIGLCSTCARIGGILAPQLLLMGDVWAKLPSLVFGGATVLAGLLILPLPETRGTKLPETMEEG